MGNLFLSAGAPADTEAALRICLLPLFYGQLVYVLLLALKISKYKGCRIDECDK